MSCTQKAAQRRKKHAGRVRRLFYLSASVADPGVDCASKAASLLHGRPDSGYVVEQPPQLEAAEITRDWQARLGAIDFLRASARGYLSDSLLGTRVQPHNGVVQWLSCHTIPDDCRFTLKKMENNTHTG